MQVMPQYYDKAVIIPEGIGTHIEDTINADDVFLTAGEFISGKVIAKDVDVMPGVALDRELLHYLRKQYPSNHGANVWIQDPSLAVIAKNSGFCYTSPETACAYK